MPHSHQHHHNHHGMRVGRRAPMPDAQPIPHPFPLVGDHLENSPLLARDPTLVDRSPPGSSEETAASSTSDTSSAPSSTCTPGDSSAICQKPTDSNNNTTLPIVLGVAIPVICAIVVFIYLHRKHVKKLRREDAQDKYKSLDFGMEVAEAGKPGKKGKKGKKGKNAPEMVATDLESEKEFRKGRGMSMDMGSPYLLPPEIHGSRESLHSLSRTIHSGDDRYRPAASFVTNDGASIRSFPSRRGDDSPYSPSNPPRRNASLANKEHDFAFDVESSPLPEMPEQAHANGNSLAPHGASGGLMPPGLGEEARDSYIVRDGGDLRRSNNYLGAFINSRASSMDPDKQPISPSSSEEYPPSPLPPLKDNEERKSPPATMTARPDDGLVHQHSYEAPIIEISEEKEFHEGHDFGDAFKVTPPSVHRTSDPNENPFDEGHAVAELAAYDGPEPAHNGLDAPELGHDLRRLSMGFRPLPPEDPSDDAEQRANRIRSFYKEYFDDSKPGPVEDYYEDYGESYLGDAAVFDPDSGQFIVGGHAPYAEPVTRRAMTPPPRAPPRFQGPPRHGPSMSNGHFMGQAPRAYSSQSGRLAPGPPGGRRPGPPRKVLPPPSPLRILPTPHMLKEDSFALPIDFAPPSTYKDRAAGRPATPTGGLKPYSPMVPVHQPLASAFDDLAVMPSPHALRRSGTFTGLDFAPPPRFRNGDTGSDAGSIRSNRSGVSAAHLHNIRTGAYRVSRLPKQTVGTKNDLMAELKPSWDMRMAV